MAATHRVVVHISDGTPEYQRRALGNVRNLLRDFPEGDIEVELHVNADGIALVLAERSAVADLLAELQALGVRPFVCRNTLVGHNVDASALLPGVGVVPATVGALIRRQAEGWAYLRP